MEFQGGSSLEVAPFWGGLVPLSQVQSDVCSDGQELGLPSRVAVVSPSFCLWVSPPKLSPPDPLPQQMVLLRFTDGIFSEHSPSPQVIQ